MTYWNAALLGLVQGLAEFLPISSSGHLAVLQNFLAIGDMENHMLFDVLLHLGTLAAVILAFWKDVREVVTEFLRMLHLRRTPRGLKPNRRERRLISFLILATLPADSGGVFIKRRREPLSEHVLYRLRVCHDRFFAVCCRPHGARQQGRAQFDFSGCDCRGAGAGGCGGAGAVALGDHDQRRDAARL